MAARKPQHNHLEEQGQSVLEFLLMLPMMIGLVVIMSRVNTAIQASIVDQQYARMQTTWLTFNSPIYPKLSLQVSQLNAKNYNQMMIGVSDNAISGDNSTPVASTTMITRTPAQANGASNQPQTEPPTRALVRIRNTVTLCTQPNVLSGAPVLPVAVTNTASIATGAYNFPESAQFDYCRGLVQ
jgi:hypothetical protein